MGNYLARVELHGGSESDYTTLHEKMAAQDFHRSLSLRQVGYQLPPATYFLAEDDVTTANAALARVVKAVTDAKFPPDPNDKKGTKGTPHTSAIIVMEAPRGDQAGLKKTN